MTKIVTPLLLCSILVLCLTSTSLQSQYPEFRTYDNGFIYSDDAMYRLRSKVNNLNEIFYSCDPEKKFYSKSQTIGYVIKLNSGDLDDAVIQLENNISIQEFIKKFPQAEIKKDRLIVKWKYKDYEDNEFVSFDEFDLKDDYGLSIERSQVEMYHQAMQGKWLFEEHKSYDGQTYINAFYFPNKFESIELPSKYSNMIAYTECMVDSTVTKIYDDAEQGDIDLPKNWKSLSIREKENLLEKFRRTQVIGYCSMDNTPRIHAKNIALLSAETFNWKVFLKAHLDILNDRFQRRSDGSYALGARHTYLKELEALNINVHDLILGITHRVENPSKNHYYGSISRVGRAIADSDEVEKIEDSLIEAISDPKLDDFNRLLSLFIFKNYISHIEDEKAKHASLLKVTKAIETLPANFIEQLN